MSVLAAIHSSPTKAYLSPLILITYTLFIDKLFGRTGILHRHTVFIEDVPHRLPSRLLFIAEISLDTTGIFMGIIVLCLTQFFAHGVDLEEDVDGLL